MLAHWEACGLDLEKIPSYPKCVTRFSEGNSPEQKAFEIFHRRVRKDGDGFAMAEGFFNFQPVEKGELLATHHGREVIAEQDAFIFMPLYQKQGNDGFFLVEEV